MAIDVFLIQHALQGFEFTCRIPQKMASGGNVGLGLGNRVAINIAIALPI